MVLTLYKLDASPPVRSVYMVIEALKIRDVEYVDVNLLEGSHLKEEFLKVPSYDKIHSVFQAINMKFWTVMI